MVATQGEGEYQLSLTRKYSGITGKSSLVAKLEARFPGLQLIDDMFEPYTKKVKLTVKAPSAADAEQFYEYLKKEVVVSEGVRRGRSQWSPGDVGL